MNSCPGSKNSINEKTARYDRIINELCHFYKVSLIKTGLMFHKYYLLNQLQVFMRYKKLPKMSFNIPLKGRMCRHTRHKHARSIIYRTLLFTRLLVCNVLIHIYKKIKTKPSLGIFSRHVLFSQTSNDD